MPRKGNILPKAAIARIMSKAGAKRVSDGSLELFSELLQRYAEEISKQSVRNANHSGRRTVMESDLKLAMK